MANATFSEVEAALVTRLKAAMPYLAQCASYAGQIDDANNGLPVEAPAAFVMFDGADVDEENSSMTAWCSRCDFSVLVVGDSYGGNTLPRTDTYGAYGLIDAVIAAVDDNSLSLTGTGFSTCSFRGVEMVRVDKLRAMYRVKFAAVLAVTR